MNTTIIFKSQKTYRNAAHVTVLAFLVISSNIIAFIISSNSTNTPKVVTWFYNTILQT